MRYETEACVRGMQSDEKTVQVCVFERRGER